MAKPRLSDDEFIRLFPIIGAQGISDEYGLQVRGVHRRRRRLEERLGVSIHAPATIQSKDPAENVRARESVKDGAVIVFSDAHYWPQDISTAHIALVRLVEELQPVIVVANGDMLDGGSISRFPPVNWEGVPELKDELACVQTRLAEVVDACPGAKHYWPLGNHDLRFNSRLASVAPEFKDIAGMHLKDHFLNWRPCMSLWINDQVVIKHRIYGGVHSKYNNTLKSGKHTVTGHTHQIGVVSWTDYNGERFGIECGTLAEPYGVQFEYTEDNPRNHVSGFAVLTFADGELMYPEFCRVVSQGVYEFRGARHEAIL